MATNFSQDEITRGYADAAELDSQAAAALGGAGSGEAEALGAAAPNPCDVWRRIRPVVVGASNLILIPGNIRRVLKQLITLVDGFCGS